MTAYLVELNDVRVSDFLENFDLASNSLYVLLVVDFLFLKHFDGNLTN